MVVPFARLPQVRLHDARLYFICDCVHLGALEPALRGGVDIFQLRDKDASDAELRRAAEQARSLCDRHGALFVVNDHLTWRWRQAPMACTWARTTWASRRRGTSSATSR